MPDGIAPSNGKAGIELRSNLHGATNVPEPTAKPVPEKYPRVATTAFGKYRILRSSKSSPPKIPGSKTVVRFLTVDR